MKKIKGLALLLLFAMGLNTLNINIKAEAVDSVETTEEVFDEILEEEPPVEEDKLGSIRLTVLASEPTLEVGKTAQFQVYINMDGLQEEYKNVVLKIKLTDYLSTDMVTLKSTLEELSIRGVTPTLENNTLVYYFDTLEGGFETSILFNLNTMNGSNLNTKTLDLTASVLADNIPEHHKEVSIEMIANKNISLSNKLKGILKEGELQERLSIRYLDEAVFSVGASINKFKSGSLALKEGSKVSISYTLAEGLTYISDTSGVTPTSDGLTYTWEFDSNNLEDDEYFFNVNFDIVTKVEGDLTLFSQVKNTATSVSTYIDESTQSEEAVSTVIVSPNFEYDLEPLKDGLAYSSIFSGPSDSVGGVGWIANDDPTVTDGALLGWNYYLTPLGATSPNYGLNSYNVFFHLDENTNFRNMFSGSFYYRPSTAFAEAGLQPIEEEVYYSVSIKYRDSDEWFKGEPAIRPDTYYSAAELGIEANRKVETLWFHFHDNETHIFWDDIGFGNVQDSAVFTLPAGLTTTSLRLWTTVDEGYVGTVTGDADLAISGWNTNENRVDMQSKGVPEELKIDWYTSFPDSYESRLLPKTAQVVTPPTGISRYVRSNAYFLNSKQNLIESGDNTLVLEILNDSASLRKLTGPFETYVLVDDGIKIHDENINHVAVLEEDYNGTGKTLFKVVFNVEGLTISSKTTARIPVTIEDSIPYNTQIEMYGYLNEDFEVSTVTNTNGTFTVKEQDLEDFNNDGSIDEEIFVTRNTYTYIDAYDFYTTLSASNNEIDYANTLTVYKDNDYTLKHEIHNPDNKPISTLSLIGVLPNIDDTYVLSDSERGSKFNVRLVGPIEVSDDFEVFYSTSQEPLVTSVLDKNTATHLPTIPNLSNVDNTPWLSDDEVIDYKDIKSYMIVKKENTKAINEDTITFYATITLDNTSLDETADIAERIGYASFATAINNTSAFEVQNLNLIYQETPIFNLTAKDVIMKLSDVKAFVLNNNLEEHVKTLAAPYLDKDGLSLDISKVMMSILNKPEVFEVGEYILDFTYDTNISSIGTINVKTKLIVIDDTEVPSEPEVPTETPDTDSKPSVDTGIQESTTYYTYILLFALLGLYSLLKIKSVRNKH